MKRILGEFVYKCIVNDNLSLDVKSDEAICDQVMDGLKPLLSNKVLPIMVEAEVSCLVPEPYSIQREKDNNKIQQYFSDR